MPVLTEEQIRDGYFYGIGGFPSLVHRDHSNYAREVKDYKGQEKLCVVCTQLANYGYSKREQARVLAEWIEFFTVNTKAFTALHLSSHVPQRLLDAVCHQENLVELQCKWGSYKDLAALEKLPRLRFLSLGSCPGVEDIAPLGRLKELVVLTVQNCKRIEDYSPLTALEKLEQLTIMGPNLGRTPVRDLEFLRGMKSLLSFRMLGVTVRRKYTAEEMAELRAALPQLSL